MRELTVRETQEIALEVLKKIDVICTELNINYFVLYGTAIGAVRHQGFIPWDDDVDIGMFREDYERFLEYFGKEEKHGLYVDHVNTNPNYPYYIARVCEKEHILFFDGYDYSSGVFVDIYPYDPLGNDGDLGKWIKGDKFIHLWRKGMDSCCARKFLKGRNIVNKILNVPYKLYSKARGIKYFKEKIDNACIGKYEWKASNYVGCPAWNDKFYSYRMEDFKETIKIPFEDMMVPLPVGYDRILRYIYGDYMQLPPEKNRVPQHGYKAFTKDKC